MRAALPLVGLRPILAEMSAVLAMVALLPAFRRHGTVGWTRAFGRALICAGLAAILVWFGRGLVPPAPLFITRAVAARTVHIYRVDVVTASDQLIGRLRFAVTP